MTLGKKFNCQQEHWAHN